jgi:uncharacterized protein
MITKFREKIKKHFEEVIKLKTSPHSIALGFAIGTFVAIFPTPGFSVWLGLLIVLIYEKINKLSLFGAIAFWNPLFITPVFAWGYKIGDYILRTKPLIEYPIVLIDRIYYITLRLVIGNTILGIIIAVISYFIVRKIAVEYQKK